MIVFTQFRGPGRMKTSLLFRRTSRLILAIVALYCTGPKTCIYGCDLISTCYRCELPYSEVDTYTYVNTADDCLALLNSSALYKTATYDASNGKCERGFTDQHMYYDSATTKVTFRKTCNSDCLTYRWTFSVDREFYYTPSGQNSDVRSRCLARCADTTNCRMLHHKASPSGDKCGWETSCGTSCRTRFDNKFTIYTRLCYTGVDCGLVPPPTNGYVNYLDTRSTEEGSRVSYNCNYGYEKANSNVSTCMADGTWSTAEFTCNPKDCGHPSNVSDGYVNYTTTTYTSTAVYTCNTGYVLTGNSVMACGATGMWNQPAPICKIDCGPPSSPVNGTVHAPVTTYLELATFTCHAGFDLVGPAVIECNATGMWNDAKPTCEIKDCGQLSNVSNGSVNYTTTTYTSTAVYTCNTGYALIGDSVIVCNASGLWNTTATICKIDCGPPVPPLNGSVHAPLTTDEEIATFTCDAGFELIGPSVLECNATGLWNDMEPTCEPGAALSCDIQWASPVSRHYQIKTTAQADYALISTTNSPSDINCVTRCNAHARANCVSGNGCHLVMYDRLTKECSRYYNDTISGITVGCDATRVCYHQ